MKKEGNAKVYVMLRDYQVIAVSKYKKNLEIQGGEGVLDNWEIKEIESLQQLTSLIYDTYGFECLVKGYAAAVFEIEKDVYKK